MATVSLSLLTVMTVAFVAVAAEPEGPKGLFNDPPTIDFRDLDADVFTDAGTTSFSEMLFDVGREQVVVGARDALYRLRLDRLTRLEKASWTAPPDRVDLCLTKGQSEEACRNYVKVLVTNGKRLFTCGTNAFSPQCTWREMENINNVLQRVPGLGKCPPNPRTNSTAFLSASGPAAGAGQFYVAGTIDFSGLDAALVRRVPRACVRACSKCSCGRDWVIGVARTLADWPSACEDAEPPPHPSSPRPLSLALSLIRCHQLHSPVRRADLTDTGQPVAA